jgi:signal transduction histidine kinase
LIADISEDLPKIKCRSQQIQQVVMNLITNARDALNEKYSGFDDNKKIEIISVFFDKNGRRWIRTTVEDRGIGIASDTMERMFDPFYTTKERYRGTGLGLSISYGIVKDHHGELRVESEPGLYTRFHMDLPVDNGWDLPSSL